MAIENDYRQGMCEIEKDLKVVGVCNSNHWKRDGWKGTKNAIRVGITATKKAYIVTLENDEEGKEILKVHTYRRKEEDVIEILEGNTAKLMFRKLNFF